MILGAMDPAQVGTWIGGVILAAATVWNSRRARNAENKVETRTQQVDTKIGDLATKTENATDTARSAARTADEAKRTAADYERMRAMVDAATASNDDLRSTLKDVRFELAQSRTRDEQCRAELLLLRTEKNHQDERIHDLEREVVAFAGQVAQLTALVNKPS
jgi:chromosome segregation ATPase